MSDTLNRSQLGAALRIRWARQSNEHALQTLPPGTKLGLNSFEIYQQGTQSHYVDLTGKSVWQPSEGWELSHNLKLSIAGALLAGAWLQSTDPKPTSDNALETAVETALQKMQETFRPPDWVERSFKIDPEEQSEAIYITAYTHLGVVEAMSRLDAVQDWWIEQEGVQALRPPIVLTIRFVG
jgi:hypothetical protein